MTHSTSYGVYICQLIRFARASSHVADFNNCEKIYSKLGCKDQESIQSSTTPDPGYQLRNFLNKPVCIINFANVFSCVSDTLTWYLNSMSDLNLSCVRVFRTRVLWRLSDKLKKVVGIKKFSSQFLIIERLAITFIYFSKLRMLGN